MNKDFSTYNVNALKSDPTKFKNEDVKEKEESKGFSFKELTSNFGKNNDDSKLNDAVVKSGESQLQFAQKLLLKQLQCQTPDNSLDPNQMLQSMMSMLNIAQNGELVSMQKENMKFQKALFYTSISAFEGEVIEHSGNEFDYNDQDQEIVFNLPAKTDKAVLSIHDEQNRCVKAVELERKEGRNSFIWDGKTQNGDNCPKGIYVAYITAQDDKNKPIDVNIRLKSHITDIVYDENELPVPMSGRIPIYDIKRRTMINRATQRYQEIAGKPIKDYSDGFTQTGENMMDSVGVQTSEYKNSGPSLSDTNTTI